MSITITCEFDSRNQADAAAQRLRRRGYMVSDRTKKRPAEDPLLVAYPYGTAGGNTAPPSKRASDAIKNASTTAQTLSFPLILRSFLSLRISRKELISPPSPVETRLVEMDSSLFTTSSGCSPFTTLKRRSGRRSSALMKSLLIQGSSVFIRAQIFWV